MEWIETRGKTIEEAVARAATELGIDERELEYTVVQEPRSGFLGIGATEAQIRARVRPVSRAKPQRRRRGREAPRARRRPGERGERDVGRSRPAAPESREDRGGAETPRGAGEATMSEVPVGEQVKVAEQFARGLLERFGLDGEVRASAEDDHVRLDIDGANLGVLIGRGGATMEAVCELVKTVLQRRTGGHGARVQVEIGGYAARRREALVEFARELAAKALATGRAQVLEPMAPADRKVVHDVVNEIEGVVTESEGEEPNRRVVIRRA